MAKRLYRVNLKIAAYALADDENDAIDIARVSLATGELEPEDAQIESVGEVTDIDRVDRRWKNAYPLTENSDAGQTCAEFLEDPMDDDSDDD